jgi:hypothetical protein
MWATAGWPRGTSRRRAALANASGQGFTPADEHRPLPVPRPARPRLPPELGPGGRHHRRDHAHRSRPRSAEPRAHRPRRRARDARRRVLHPLGRAQRPAAPHLCIGRRRSRRSSVRRPVGRGCDSSMRRRRFSGPRRDVLGFTRRGSPPTRPSRSDSYRPAPASLRRTSCTERCRAPVAHRRR